MVLLREFLYVDTEKVRGLLAQLDGGIIETQSDGERSGKSTSGGVKGFAEHVQQWGNEVTTQKSLGDAIFVTLEAALETEGVLVDLSSQLQDTDFWHRDLEEMAPPGTLVRISGPASLFDARYVTSTLAGFATAGQGLNVIDPPETGSKPVAPNRPGKNQSRPGGVGPQLEDIIPDVTLNFGGDSIKGSFMRAIIQVARGLFSPGLHFVMSPTGDTTFAITARLQEGRQFLDSEPDILFARYGTSAQEWTVVGTIGHYGRSANFDASKAKFVDPVSSNINRPLFAEFVNEFLSHQATLGFADAPQPPGFSVVPLAVYRVLPNFAAPKALGSQGIR